MAYSKARRKLKHTAFVELNAQAIVQTMYEDAGGYRTLRGLRILAIDGSKIVLPDTDETRAEFGVVPFDSPRGGVTGERCYGRMSILYDVLNHIALDAHLVPGRQHEIDTARLHMSHTRTHDLVIYDRGYASYRMMAFHTMHGQGHFLMRCSRKSFAAARRMMQGDGPDDVIVTLQPNDHVRAWCKKTGEEVPASLTVRFIRVTLDTGEHEVLVTSLLDQEQFPGGLFKELYWLRWGVETFYSILKTRLGIENFSGHSVEAIRQDFHAAILLTGLEALFTEEAEVKLGQQTGGHKKQVNKAVSFNAIKHRAFELFYSNQPTDQVLEELTRLFQTSPTLVRPDKQSPRGTTSATRRLRFWQQKRKGVF